MVVRVDDRSLHDPALAAHAAARASVVLSGTPSTSSLPAPPHAASVTTSVASAHAGHLLAGSLSLSLATPEVTDPPHPQQRRQRPQSQSQSRQSRARHETGTSGHVPRPSTAGHAGRRAGHRRPIATPVRLRKSDGGSRPQNPIDLIDDGRAGRDALPRRRLRSVSTDVPLLAQSAYTLPPWLSRRADSTPAAAHGTRRRRRSAERSASTAGAGVFMTSVDAGVDVASAEPQQLAGCGATPTKRAHTAQHRSRAAAATAIAAASQGMALSLPPTGPWGSAPALGPTTLGVPALQSLVGSRSRQSTQPHAGVEHSTSDATASVRGGNAAPVGGHSGKATPLQRWGQPSQPPRLAQRAVTSHSALFRRPDASGDDSGSGGGELLVDPEAWDAQGHHHHRYHHHRHHQHAHAARLAQRALRERQRAARQAQLLRRPNLAAARVSRARRRASRLQRMT